MARIKQPRSRARLARGLSLASAVSGAVTVLAVTAGPAPGAVAAQTAISAPARVGMRVSAAGPPARTTAVSAALSLRSPGRLVNIGGGRRMFLECRGKGSPTVILESGYRDNSAIWTFAEGSPSVLRGVAKFTRVCAYDRPGTFTYLPPNGKKIDFSRSTPVHQPTTAGEDVSDLHRLLSRAHIRGRYVLVAHSADGLIAQLYASTHRHSVAGLVLVDAFPPVISRLMGRFWPAYRAILNAVPQGLEDYKVLEYLAFGASFQQILNARPLPPMPLVVLSHSRDHPFMLPPTASPALSKKLEAAWRKGQRYLASLEPRSLHIVANAGHYIQTEDPALVIRSIRHVVEAVRGKDAM